PAHDTRAVPPVPRFYGEPAFRNRAQDHCVRQGTAILLRDAHFRSALHRHDRGRNVGIFCLDDDLQYVGDYVAGFDGLRLWTSCRVPGVDRGRSRPVSDQSMVRTIQDGKPAESLVKLCLAFYSALAVKRRQPALPITSEVAACLRKA